MVWTGQCVIGPLENFASVVLTGRKAEQKTRQRYSGYPGGRRTESYQQALKRHPERVVEDAIRRMLPKTRLGRKMFTKLKVYPGTEHPHAAQNPESLTI